MPEPEINFCTRIKTSRILNGSASFLERTSLSSAVIGFPKSAAAVQNRILNSERKTIVKRYVTIRQIGRFSSQKYLELRFFNHSSVPDLVSYKELTCYGFDSMQLLLVYHDTNFPRITNYSLMDYSYGFFFIYCPFISNGIVPRILGSAFARKISIHFYRKHKSVISAIKEKENEYCVCTRD